ncbi:probable peptidyl-tRNA hydrolase 2 isoform X2 [Setaria italica]|uniref:probable peptidyl-tRNA hydrolase 2 isoform X2 n=1 Tax=Setaria italica TaxID=4555 RepID=UPI000649221C|nr:probable peptidyl-tRNA hydrolase 2 isoform X2 [Setaria italica]
MAPPPRRNQPQNPTRRKGEEPWLAASLRPANFLPGLAIGFLLGLLLDLSSSWRPKSNPAPAPAPAAATARGSSSKRASGGSFASGGEELKMVLVVRQDLKMGAGKIASQCAHAATGLYAELLSSNRGLLRQWEQLGQAKIVLTCKNQQEMNRLKEMAQNRGIPTFIVADAGRTQVLAGSKTVLAIGPGRKADIDSVTGKLRLLFSIGDTNLVLREFEKCGVILRHHSGPRDGNWIHILYQRSYDARKALQKNGIQLSSGLIVGVKPIDPVHRQQLDQRLIGSNQGGFMVSLPSKSLALKSTGSSNQLGALPRPYDPKANTNVNRDAGRRATGSVAAPAKSIVTNVMDLIFGI